MHILYLDDAGSPQNKKEDYFVLDGVSVPENSIYWLSNQLEQIADRIAPGRGGDIEFHASATFTAKTAPWKGMEKPERIKAIQSVLHTLDSAHNEIRAFACAIHKNSFPNHDPVEAAFEDLCSRFQFYLSRLSTRAGASQPYAKGLIVFDKSVYENVLQGRMRHFKTLGTRWGNNIRDIVEVPLFVDSRASRLIQLADHVAYAVFRRYNAGDINYFNCIQGRFDADAGTIHGLVHKQSNDPLCTCPACITRNR